MLGGAASRSESWRGDSCRSGSWSDSSVGARSGEASSDVSEGLGSDDDASVFYVSDGGSGADSCGERGRGFLVSVRFGEGVLASSDSGGAVADVGSAASGSVVGFLDGDSVGGVVFCSVLRGGFVDNFSLF